MTIRKILLAIPIIVVLSIGVLYYQFVNLKVYEWNGNLITRNGIRYEPNLELSTKYIDGELNTEKIIGRFTEDKFWGFKTWVLKIKGYDEKEVFLIKGLMFEEVFEKQK